MIKSRIVKIKDSRLKVVREGYSVMSSLEGENPGGSIKDHMVEGELLSLLQTGALKAGDRISEISSGSTARSLAYYSLSLGLECGLFVPFSLNEEKRDFLKNLGASLHFVDPVTGYADYASYLQKNQIRSFNQFGNRSLARHYASLSKQVAGRVDCVIGTVGTGHSLLGVTDGFGRGITPTSAEPLRANQVPGIRNVRLEHFGEGDPCATERLNRIEVLSPLSFQTLETDCGLIEVNPTFSFVLGALEQLNYQWSVAPPDKRPQSIFLVGADSKSCAA